MRTAHRECFDIYVGTVLLVWNLQIAPDERRLQEARSALAECLIENGVDVDAGDPAAFSAILQQADEAVIPIMDRCSQRVSDEFGIPGFVG